MNFRKHSEVTARIPLKRGETYLVDVLRYPAQNSDVVLMLIGGDHDKRHVRALAMKVAGEVGLSLEAERDLVVVGINDAQAESKATNLLREVQKKLDAEV